MANERGALIAWWILAPGGVWYEKTAYRLVGCIGMAIFTEDNWYGRKVCQDRGDIRAGNIREDFYEL